MAGLLGSGGPLGAVGGLTDTVGGVAGSDGPLSTVGGLTDGLPLGDLGGGLLGGSEGLNLLGIAGVGSDDKAVLDINPAEKKEVKAQKAELAKKRKQAREQQLKQLQDAVKQQQGGTPTPEQEQAIQKLREGQRKDDADMEKINKWAEETPNGNATGSSGPLGGAIGQNGPFGGATGALGGLTGQNGPLGGATGALGGVTGVSNGFIGGGGPLGSLLGGGQGLNVAGIVALGSDEEAALDISPAEKKKSKLAKLQKLQQEKAEHERKKKALEELRRQRGGQLTPEEEAARRELEQRDIAFSAAENSLFQGIQRHEQETAGAGGGYISTNNTTGEKESSKGGCLCLAPPDSTTLPPPSLFYAYLAPSDVQAGQVPYILTFANAQVAEQWHQSVKANGVQKMTPQWFTYSGAPPYPASPDTRFQSVPWRGCVLANKTNPEHCCPLLPPQTSEGYHIPSRGSHVHVANATCTPPAHASQDGTVSSIPPITDGKNPIAQSPQVGTGSFIPPNTGGGGPFIPGTTGVSHPVNPGNRGPDNPTYPGSINPISSGSWNPGIPNNPAGFPPQSTPQRPKYTLENAANDHAQNQKAQGDPRPIEDIRREALEDLRGDCCNHSSNGINSGNVGQEGITSNTTGSALPIPSSLGAANGSGGLGHTAGGVFNGLPGAPLPTGGGTEAGGLLGGLGGGLLGGGQGLNVAGIAGIGSDQPAALDINPAQKQQERLAKAQQLAQHKAAYQQRKQQLEALHRQQGNMFTPTQQLDYQQTQQAIQQLEAQQQAQAVGPVPGGIGNATNVLPIGGGLGGVTSALPIGGGLGGALPLGA